MLTTLKSAIASRTRSQIFRGVVYKIMDQFLLLGDHVLTVAGGPIGEVIDLDTHSTELHQLALVEFYWGVAYWYKSIDVVRTHSPISK